MPGSIGIVLHDLSLGGTERIALRLADRWAAAGRDVTLITGSRTGPLCPLVPRSIETVALSPAIPRGRGSRRRLADAAAAEIARRRPDIVFIPGNFHWPVAEKLGRARTRAKVVAQISAPLRRIDRGPARQALFNARARFQLRAANALVSLSDAMTAEADSIFGRGRTRRIALPALDDDSAAPQAIDRDCRTILAAGRLVPEKGFLDAIEAFARIGDRRARLVIVGEGPERAALEERAKRLGVADRVSLPGYVPDIRPWLDKARLLLVTSQFEGFGAVIVEALSAGRQVVATDCSPSVGDLVARPGHGAVVPVGDVDGLAKALRKALLEAPTRTSLLATSVNDYRIGAVAEAYLDLFDMVA